MVLKLRNYRRGLVAVAILGLLISGAFAFTAANTVPGSKAGDGAGAITGYVASSIHYVLNSDNVHIDTLTFDLDSAPIAGSTMKAQLDTIDGHWFTCTNAGVTVHLSCDLTGHATLVSAVDQLRVVVAD